MDTQERVLENRKERIERRLRRHKITETSITFLPYLEFDDTTFATPYEVGCRIFILYAIVYTIQEPSKRDKVVSWLNEEKLWNHTSSRERHYLEGQPTDQRQINEFSWDLEAAYLLAWTVKLVKEQPSPAQPVTDDQMDEFFDNVAPLGDPVVGFLGNLTFRDTEEIFEESIFYELTTGYFRDELFSGKSNTVEVDKGAGFVRHKALNWLRRFMGETDWGETDTST